MPVFDPFGNSAAVQGSAALNMSDRDAVSLPGGYSLSITSFTQSLGAELLTNGNFASGLTGWSITNETPPDPEVTEVAPGNGHGGGGSGAMNIFSSASANVPRANQTVLTAGSIYEVAVNVTARVAGSILVLDSGAGFSSSYASVGSRRILGRPANTIFRIQGGPTSDVTVDDCSVKLITKNAPVNAVADGVFDLYFPTPVSPVAGDRITLIFRMASGANQELVTCWAATYLRNDANNGWNTSVDRYAGGTINSITGATGVGDANGIRIRALGSSIRMFTLVDGVETQRGSTITSATIATNTILNTVYTSAFAPTLFQITG